MKKYNQRDKNDPMKDMAFIGIFILFLIGLGVYFYYGLGEQLLIYAAFFIGSVFFLSMK